MDAALNGPEPRYWDKIRTVASTLRELEGPIIIASHVDPDGDAIGSSLGLARALKTLDKKVTWIADPPRYLRFLVKEDEYSDPIERMPAGGTLVVLDSAEPDRVAGVPVEGFVINIDHHGTNPRFGYLAVVDPSKAAAAQMVKDLIDALGVAWNAEIATPVLTGLITDTGNFRFGNTTPEVLHMAAELVGYGVNLAELTDRLQWRPTSYFKAMGAALSTVEFHFGGLLVTAHMPPDVTVEDSDDFVGMIRYAEGCQIAVFLRERAEGVVKLSIRSRGGVSAQAVAVKLGGGGHVPAAGASLRGVSLDEAYQRLLASVEQELRRVGYI
jgi:phosphoesterase RecJ-like protein